MASTATPIASLAEERGEVDEAAEKLLSDNRVGIVQKSIDDGQINSKSSKKVKLPEDGGPASGRGAGRFTIGPAPERDWEMVPPDGQWGWLILVGATVVNILIPGTIKSSGVLLVEFNEVFSTTQSATYGIIALCYFLYSSLGPLSSVLSVKWSYRTVTLIGGTFAAVGMILCSFAFNITYLYFSFGALLGAGAGLAFPPTVYIVTSYFVRYRGLANGICMSGSAFGSIILPPVMRKLLDSYGYQGTVLILGGVMLNVWAAALLFQPVEQHLLRRYKDNDEEEPELPQDDILFEEDETEAFEMKPPTEQNGETNNHPVKNVSQNQLATAQNAMPSMASQNQLRQNASKRKLSYPRPIPKTNYSSASINADGVSEIRKLGSQETFGRKLSYAGPKRNFSTSSFAHISATPFHGSTLSAFEQPNEFASQFSLKSVTESVADVAYCCFCCKRRTTKKEPNKYFDITLLTDPSYLVILLSSSTVAISCTNFIIFLPFHAEIIGFSKDQGAYLLSTVSAFDLVGRIGGSAICDLNLMPKWVYYCGGLLISGLTLIVIPFLPSYMTLSVACGVFGLASGINNSVTTLVMAEILGVERLMSTYGLSLFVNGLLQLIGPPLCGLWFDYEKNYSRMFITFGFIFVAGTSLWLLMPIINKRKRENEKKLVANGQKV